ncbi:hypothetical protein BGZ97_012056 [Linnemannia gamsii]|uniref:F-box domain-containing protein n=1 Tax=Linnemannia gamsii TaxID=64522 RepID=A0A9P6UL18_9FUNG|nr:hypothetical protein BGZ97_012056 [Linnemannia gamsii]
MSGTHNHPQPGKILFMSEATDIFGSYLTPPDILSCILVCRAWYALFIPHLYDTLDDSLYAWPELLDPSHKQGTTTARAITLTKTRKDLEWILQIFTKYGHLVRRLCTKRYLFSDAAAQTCTRLTSLKLRKAYLGYPFEEKDNPIPWHPAELSTALQRPPSTVDRVWIGAQWLWHLIQRNKETLQELELCDFLSTPYNDNLLDTLESCRRLTKLTNNWISVPFQDLLKRMSHLRHYTYSNPTYHSSAALLLTSPMPQLVTLRIFYGITKAVFFSLLSNLPNLEELTTGCRYEDYIRGDGDDVPRSAIKFAPSRLQRLHFTRWSPPHQNEDHRMLNEILPWVPDLIEIGISHLDCKTAIVIVSNCLQLQSFRHNPYTVSIRRYHGSAGVDNGPGIVLCNSVHLTEFDGVRYEIEARSLVLNPWICEGLVVLRLQIVGVTRLTEEEEMDYKQGLLFQRLNRILSEAETKALEKYEEVQNQHYKIYSQLSKLVHLKVLELGMEYRDIAVRYRFGFATIQRGAQWYQDYGDPFPDTLELSLSSGLEQLSTLTKLEVFGFESVDHRIDEEELIWMAEKWPRLRVMRGLHEVDDLPLLRHDGEKWHRRVFMQRLRPDVRHEKRYR